MTKLNVFQTLFNINIYDCNRHGGRIRWFVGRQCGQRKERLAALKRKLQSKDGEESGNGKGEEEDESLPTPVFRSYKPQAPELQESAFDQADPHLIEEKIQVEESHFSSFPQP